ncbi:DUF3822 family protein [Rapidithrix thailandica]|uniref:DUF3822 family protein n=1 Tax=Rapidithrix thailandica TaxID=413964 RepID=A0AAW9S9Y2_9BACT
MEDILIESARYKLKDKSFDPELLSSYHLTIKVHPSYVSIAVFNLEDHLCLSLESYLYEKAENATSLIVRLHNIWNRHEYLNAAFWNKISLLIVNDHFTLVPAQLAQLAPEAYLKLNTPVNLSEQSVFQKEIDTLQLQCDFVVEKELVTWFEERYPNKTLEITHVNAAFLQGLVEISQEAAAEEIFILLNKELVSIANFKEGKLHYFNSFRHQMEDDIIYYLSLVADELQLSTQSAKIVLWGDVEENEETFSLLQRFFKNVGFGGRPTSLKFGYIFDEVPDHFEYDIFSVFLA